MLPILFVIFFLAQAQLLQVGEFPNLLKHVDVTWGDKVITRQLNVRQTMSIDKEAPSFILCGPFKTSGKDGQCRLSYRYSYHPSPSSTYSGSGGMSATAKLISTINETYSCMSFENKLDDFPNLYKRTELSSYDNSYTASYTCETSDAVVSQGTSPFALVVIAGAVLFIICGAGSIAYKCGEAKTGKGLEENELYQANFEGVIGGNQQSSGGSTGGVVVSSGPGYKSWKYEKEWTF